MVTTDVASPIKLSQGYVHDAPDHAAAGKTTVAWWLRSGTAVRHCRPSHRCTTAHIWGTCAGHNDGTPQPGDRLVIGKPGHPDPGSGRAVYLVDRTTQTAVHLTREA